ncbi:MAG TPA: transposase [Terriglobales bacterium]|nr:transposase [Terriglobales bacterium]
MTIDSYNKAFILQSDCMAGLFADVLQRYRHEQKMLVHEFVVMPNHVHALLTTCETVEFAVKRIKGCFSTRAIKEFHFKQKIWQPSFYERRVRDSNAYSAFRTYIRDNPVRARLVDEPEKWGFGSASGHFEMDPAPTCFSRPEVSIPRGRSGM